MIFLMILGLLRSQDHQSQQRDYQNNRGAQNKPMEVETRSDRGPQEQIPHTLENNLLPRWQQNPLTTEFGDHIQWETFDNTKLESHSL